GGGRGQLVMGRAAEAPAGARDLLEPRLDLLPATRLCSERLQEPAQLGCRLAQPQLDVAELVAGALELGREPLERRHRALGAGRKPGGALPVLRGERLRRAGRRFGELAHVAEPLALRA